MSNIEKIRAEIERLISMNKTRNGFPAGMMCAIRIEAYENLLSFLSTLSEEPDKSLEEAAKTFCDTLEGKEAWSYGPDHYDWGDANNAFIAGARWQKEQKPIQTSEEKEYIRTLKSLISDFIRDKQPEDVAFYQKIYDWLEGRHIEQKPITEVFGFKVGDAVKLKDGDGRKHIIKSFEEVGGIHGPNFYHVEFEDNSARDGIYPGEEYPNGYYTQMEKFEEEQKPAEWSEDDEKMIKSILFVLESYVSKAENELSPALTATYPTYYKEIDWLKSLRPQPHTVSIKDATKFGNLEYERGVKDGIQSEKSRQWKPSEEQMTAILRAEGILRLHEQEEVAKRLAKLYDHLKELM